MHQNHKSHQLQTRDARVDSRSGNNRTYTTTSIMTILQYLIDVKCATTTTTTEGPTRRWEDWIQERYLRNNTIGHKDNNNNIVIRHFVFRINVPIVHECKNAGVQVGNNPKNKKTCDTQQQHVQQRNKNTEHLVQYICSSYCDHDVGNNEDRLKLWTMYHKLQLRLRCGSSKCTDALRYAIDEKQNDRSVNSSARRNHPTSPSVKLTSPTRRPTIDKDCPMIVLSESLPNMDGMTYVTEDDTITYFTMNGNGFELYVPLTNCFVAHSNDTIVITVPSYSKFVLSVIFFPLSKKMQSDTSVLRKQYSM